MFHAKVHDKYTRVKQHPVISIESSLICQLAHDFNSKWNTKKGKAFSSQLTTILYSEIINWLKRERRSSIERPFRMVIFKLLHCSTYSSTNLSIDRPLILYGHSVERSILDSILEIPCCTQNLQQLIDPLLATL